MKTTTLTPTGEIHITITGKGRYRLTHHSRPTQTVIGETELLAQIAASEGEELCLRLIAKDNATIALTPDNRHGVNGWRGCRYLDIGKPSKLWDEWYLFFETLHDAIEACCKTGPDAEDTIHEARSRF